jgi:hypothetical protein
VNATWVQLDVIYRHVHEINPSQLDMWLDWIDGEVVWDQTMLNMAIECVLKYPYPFFD